MMSNKKIFLQRALALFISLVMLLTVLASCKNEETSPQKNDPPRFVTFEPEEVYDENAFRVMSFNLQTSLLNKREDAVFYEIALYSPDLLGVQEDSGVWNAKIVDRFAEYTQVTNSAIASGKERCSIFFRTERYELIDSGHTYLSDDGTAKIALTLETMPAEALQPFKDAGYKFTKNSDLTQTIYKVAGDKSSGSYSSMIGGARPMTWVVLQDKQSGEKLIYINTHVQHRGGLHPTLATELRYVRELERMAQWNFLIEDLAQIKAEHGDLPTVITGDLNELPGSNSYKLYTSAHDDTAKLAQVYKGTDGTWNLAYSSSYNGKVVPYDDSSAGKTSREENVAIDAIDYCLVTPNAFTVHKFEVAPGIFPAQTDDGKDGAMYASDHKALVVDLSIGKKEPLKALQSIGNENADSISNYSGKPDTSWYDNAVQNKGFVLVNADQLMGFLELRSQGKTFDGITLRLDANMVFSNVARPSVAADNLFHGIFEGNGYYVAGLNMTASDGSAGGFFGALGNNAAVKDLSILNGSATDGALASEIAPGANVVLSNLLVNVSVTGEESVGGLIGKIGEGAKVSMNACRNLGTVNATGAKVGGLIGEVLGNESYLRLTTSLNKGAVTGGDMTGGLIGYSTAPALTVSSCANLGSVKALRCSGGLIGTIDACEDLVLSNCVVKADLDFSAIGAGGTAQNPVSVPAGLQVGGLIGRTYGVKGCVTDCLVTGSMKATKAVKTKLDTTGETGGLHNYLASGGVVGFNSQYASHLEVETGDVKKNHLHFDTIMVSLELTDVASVLGGTRDFPVNGLSTHRLSWSRVLYNDKLMIADTTFGWRIQKDRLLDSSGEINAQIREIMTLTNDEMTQWNPKNVKESAYARWIYNEAIAYPVPNSYVNDLLNQ